MNIDLDNFRARRDQSRTTHRHAMIEALARDQHYVSVAKRVHRRAILRRIGIAHAERMIVRNESAREGDGVERDSCPLDELLQLAAGVAPPGPAARDDDRPLRLLEQRECGGDVRAWRDVHGDWT